VASAGRVKYAEAMIQAKSYGPAIQVLQQHLAATPSDQRARYLLGMAAYRAGDNALAYRTFTQLVQEAPTLVPAHYYLGITLARMGRIDEARQHLTAAVTLDPSYTAARDRLAQLEASVAKPAAGPAPASGQTERLTPGERLHSGGRRLSSFAGRFLLVALMAAAGIGLMLNAAPGRLSWLADRLTFPPPSYFEELLEQVRGTPLEAQVLDDLADARAASAQMSASFDSLLGALAIGLLVLAVVLVVHALLASMTTRYEVYQRRIDVSEGVLNRKRSSVWLYEITDVQLLQPAWMTITGNAEVRLVLEDMSKVKITGFGPTDKQLSLWGEIRDAAIIERREMKNIWV
jgi:hypothetical protein